MSLRLVLSPTPGRITPAKLRAELLAAGVPLQPEKPLEPLNCYYSGNHFAVLLPVDTDQWDTTVQQVVAAHVPDQQETKKQRRKRKIRELLGSKDELIALLFAANRELFESLRETRAWCNQLRQQLNSAALPITVPTLQNRTWEQATASVVSRADATIDAEIEEVNP